MNMRYSLLRLLAALAIALIAARTDSVRERPPATTTIRASAPVLRDTFVEIEAG